MKAPQEHEPEHGLRGVDTHDGVARAGGFDGVGYRDERNARNERDKRAKGERSRDAW